MSPLVSVITACYNSELTIEKTILSILSQTYDFIEYIIIDGNSTDRTLEIIKKYENKFLARGYKYIIVSENDEGIADAWNKGLSFARGEIIGILNADDYYDEVAVEVAVRKLNVTLPELSYGVCHKLNSKGGVQINNVKFNPRKIYYNLSFSHTTCFQTKVIFDVLGNFDKKYKIAFDVDFLLRAWKRNICFISNDNITYMLSGGVSDKQRVDAIKEYRNALIENGFNKQLAHLFCFIKLIYYYWKIKK